MKQKRVIINFLKEFLKRIFISVGFFTILGIIMNFIRINYGDQILILVTMYAIIVMFILSLLVILLLIITAILEIRKNNHLLKKSFNVDINFFSKYFPQYKFETFKELFFVRSDLFNKAEYSESKEMHEKLRGIVADINVSATQQDREVAAKILSFYDIKNNNYKMTKILQNKILQKYIDFGKWFLMQPNDLNKDGTNA